MTGAKAGLPLRLSTSAPPRINMNFAMVSLSSFRVLAPRTIGGGRNRHCNYAALPRRMRSMKRWSAAWVRVAVVAAIVTAGFSAAADDLQVAVAANFAAP